MTRSKDISDDDVREMARAIQRVSAKSGEVWVSWRRAAKEWKGSEEYAELLESIASIEKWRRFFAFKGAVVTLTVEGRQFIAAVSPPRVSEIGSVADAVRQYASRLRRISLTVTGIGKVATVEKRVVHAVMVDASDEAVASETPCEFRPRAGGSLTRGRVIGQEPGGDVLYVAFDAEVSASSLPGVLSIDRAFLLQQLAERLRQLRDIPPRMLPALRPTKETTVAVAGDNSMQVARELATLPAPWTRFLWGPPGAGKTFGIGYLLTLLHEVEPTGRTLIVAPSNRAVDVALEQFLGHLGLSERRDLVDARRILRFGYPKKASILERAELLGPKELDALSRQVRLVADKIARAEREERGEKEVALLRAELLNAQEAVKTAVTAHVGQCAVVATTSTLAYLPTSPVADFRWDNVIVDEVTMVTPAMCTFLASLVTKRLLFAGDPRQLGPVYETIPSADEKNAFEWMGRDIFDKSGVSRGEGEDRTIALEDGRLARITCQRRCAEPIWERVSYLYPKVQNQSDAKRNLSFTALPPHPDEAVVILDTAACPESRCVRAHSSWENPFTAEIAIETVRSIVASASGRLSIAIISPYRAQVRLLRQRIRQELRASHTPWAAHDIDAGTVHQFQGSDADIILFDMVDGSGRDRVGNLLASDAGIRLVNVAFTRAKGKLVVIADTDWCGAFLKRETNPLLYELIVGRNRAKRLQVVAREAPIRAEESVALSSLLAALMKSRIFQMTVTGVPIQDNKGAIITTAPIAFPTHKHAVFIDGPAVTSAATNTARVSPIWTIQRQNRHRLTDAGWTFSAFRAEDVLQDPNACARSVQMAVESGPMLTSKAGST